MSNIIEDFYYGNLEPQECNSELTSKLKKKLSNLAEKEEQLSARLTSEEKELFQNYVSAYIEFSTTSNADSFISGFRLGAKFAYDEWFTHMSHKYEIERTELKGKISELRKKLSSTQETTKGKDMFLNAVRSFVEMENLTAPLAKELIDHIDVYESEGKGKNKTQRIVIYYRFVGYIELPDKIPIVNDTRQGVAVNYISGALPETA